MNRIIRAAAAFIVSICLILAPPMAYANTSVGGWSAVDVITAGATNTINATKTAGGKALKSAVAVAPSAVKVGKHLIKGGGSAALLIAVPQLLGDGVDWVLDPANNSVRYTVAGTVDPDAATPADRVIWKAPPSNDYIYATPQAAARVVCAYRNQTYGAPYKVNDWQYYVPCKRADGSTDTWDVQAKPNPAYDPDYKPNAPTEKHLPIDTVAAQVISNAEAGDPSSQEAVKATALEGFAAGEHDAALDAAATESDADTENPPDTTDPENPSEPAEPFDPAGIISAINALKAMLAGILSSITGFFDWAMADPQIEEPDMTPPEIEDITKYDTIDLNQGYVTASGQCPSAVDLNINFGVIQLSYEPLCLILEKLSGVIVAVAYISVGFMIIRTV